jgi:hypothetical protein
MKIAKEVALIMTSRQDVNRTTHKPARYAVRLASRGGKVVYAKSLTQKRILESAERIIAKANKKTGQ